MIVFLLIYFIVMINNILIWNLVKSDDYIDIFILICDFFSVYVLVYYIMYIMYCIFLCIIGCV